MHSRVIFLIVTFLVISGTALMPLAPAASAAQATGAATAEPTASAASATSAATTQATPAATQIATPASGALPYLGVLTRPAAQGFEVIEVVPGSPADAAGFKVGDVIVSVNSETVSSAQPFSAAVSKYAAGAKITVGVTRNSGPQLLTVTLGARVAATPAALPSPAAGSPGFVGIGLVDADTGIRIDRVAPGSAAERAGLKVDDIIASVDTQPITSVGQVRALIASKQPGQTLSIGVKRGTETLTVTVTLDNTVTLVPTAPPTPNSALPYAPGAARIQLGVQYTVVTDTLAAARSLGAHSGALITDVQPDSPAELAGLKLDDIVTEVDGDKVDAKHTLAVRMVAYGAGDTLTLTVVRGHETLQLVVTLAARGVA